MTPKFFDAHTHLNMQFEHDWKEVGKRTIENGVWFVNVGADAQSSKLAVEQAHELGDGCWATVGIHPTEGGESDFAMIVELAKDDKVVAIGECGLEYFRLPEADKSVIMAKQKELFKKHIELALEVGKPLMIHCRADKNDDAYKDAWEILKSYKDKVGDKLKFDMHFFASDLEIAQKFLDLGGYLSFPGVITFASQYDEVVKNMPLDRIMSETDAPFATPKVDPKAGFATPVPHRGERNEPACVEYVAKRICELRFESEEVILDALMTNAKRFFGLT